MDLVQGLFDAQGCEASRGVLVPTLLHQFHQGRQGLERERGEQRKRRDGEGHCKLIYKKTGFETQKPENRLP